MVKAIKTCISGELNNLFIFDSKLKRQKAYVLLLNLSVVFLDLTVGYHMKTVFTN